MPLKQRFAESCSTVTSSITTVCVGLTPPVWATKAVETSTDFPNLSRIYNKAIAREAVKLGANFQTVLIFADCDVVPSKDLIAETERMALLGHFVYARGCEAAQHQIGYSFFDLPPSSKTKWVGATVATWLQLNGFDEQEQQPFDGARLKALRELNVRRTEGFVYHLTHPTRISFTTSTGRYLGLKGRYHGVD